MYNSRYQIKYYGNIDSLNVFIQPIDEHDESLMNNELSFLKELSNSDDFLIITILINDWNKELTPWENDQVIGKERFGRDASKTLDFILTNLIKDQTKNYFLCGYSLAGLFSLWCGYQTNVFAGIVSASASLWYPGWIEYIKDKEIKTKYVYLSLGDKEHLTKNPIMSKVKDNMIYQYDLLLKQNILVFVEYNPGNHFMDSDKRIAKGMNWLLKRI